MADEFSEHDDPDAADRADAEEAEAAAEEAFSEAGAFGEEAPFDAEAMLTEARINVVRARAAWSLVHPELSILLLANCFFFVGALASWSRDFAWSTIHEPAMSGLDTVRGAVIFALALYGFWIMVFNIWHRQLIVWPFLLNALLALWIGIPGFTHRIGSQMWDEAGAYVDGLRSKSLLDGILVPLSTIPPGHWLLTAGGAIVLIVLLKGVLGGASGARGAGAGEAEGGAGGAGGRRRRR